MANILVTGGAGYLGSILVPKLLELGHKVHVLDNFMYSQTSLLTSCKSENLEITNGDAADEKTLLKVLKDIDFIFPLACLTGAPLCEKKPQEAQRIIFDAIEILLRVRDDKQKIIYPTTNSGYGKADESGWCDESSPLNPVSLYGKLKNNTEKLLLENNNVITFRLATVFGTSPRMRIDLIVNDFVHRAINDKVITLFESHFTRNFLYINDAVDAFIFALNNFNDLKNNCYNLGNSNENISKLELCNKIKKIIPDVNILECEFTKDPDQRDYLVSNKKIELAGFKAQTPLEQGIQELVKSFSYLKTANFRNI